MMEAFYITTPIYYVNDKPHIGHAYTSLMCDVLARFYQWEGRPVFFLTGTDEHGQKVEKAAQEAGVSPQVFVDQVSQNFRHLSEELTLSHTDFIRTTEERHKKAAQALWEALEEKGHIYQGTYAGWYSVRDEAFYGEEELIEGRAPTGAPVEWVEEPSYFFRLSAFQEPLLNFYKDHPDFIRPESRRNEVIRFVESGLRDLSISRTSFKWGVKVPGCEGHIMYVWLDALTNYITALGYPEKGDLFETYWPQALHVVGKDILRFHAVYWPAFLLGAGLPLPKGIFAHGWWTHEGQKISKSLGNTIDPLELIKSYGLDQVRYFLMREVPFGQDGDFSKASLIQRVNSQLANDWGNLGQRVLSFIQKNCEGQVPTPGVLKLQDEALLKKARDLLEKVRGDMRELAFHRACDHIWEVIGEGNRYVDHEKPWSLKAADPERMKTILWVLAEVIRRIAFILQSFLPQTTAVLLDQLGIPVEKRSHLEWDTTLKPGSSLPVPTGIFPRLKEEEKA